MREIKSFESQGAALQQSKKERDYWLDKLAGEIVKHGFPCGKKISFPGDTKRDVIQFAFPGDLSAQLLKISRGFEPNLYTTCTAVVILLLSKYTGAGDITVGIPVLKQEGDANFINTVLVLRTRVAGDMTFKEFLLQVRQTIAEALEHQNYPIETLVYKLNVEFVETDFPLFDVAVLLENIQDKGYLHPIKPNITFSFRETDGSIAGELEYNALLYEKAALLAVIGHLKNLLRAVIFNSAIKIAAVEILSAEERKRLLVEFNNNKAGFAADKTIDGYIEKHALATPGSTALVYNDEVLTYGELAGRIHRWASALKNNGIRRGQLAGILLNPSPLMVECILAAWKTGCAYIPMDTNWPVQRTADMLKDSQASVLLTRPEYVQPQLAKIAADKLMVVGKNRPPAPPYLPNPDTEPVMNRLAYIIYTSGSLGTPKGAMVEHTGMMNHIQAKIDDLHLTGESIIAQNASHCFDISVWQFFTALVLGGRTVIYPDELILEPAQFLSGLRAHRVTILEVVPSYLSTLLGILDLEPSKLNCLKYLKYLLVTGETVKPGLVGGWFDKYPGIGVVNAYGPTEASDDITHYIMDKAPEAGEVPIGKPLRNLNIYIVDEYMQLCPPGVKGEIVVSGVGVGRGYLNDPAKTHRAFTRAPFSAGRPVRLYKTGDLGRWLPDGTIAFFGRKDYQVKIRGYRIELEEIEKKLVNYPGIREAVVIEKEKHLCAFAVSREKLEIAAVKAYLEEILPGYMIPEYIRQIDRMPLTWNRKIDRKALAALEISMPEQELAAAASEIEKKLADIWSGVLGIDKDHIGIDANFFHLGGHSLKAALLAAKIRKAFGTGIQLKDIFDLPTIRTFAKFVRRAVKDEFVSVEPAEKKEYYPLSSAQKRLFFIQQLTPEGIAYNLPAVYIIEGELKEERLAGTFRKLIERHENLRTSFKLAAGTPVQEIHGFAGVEFAVEYYEAPGTGHETVDHIVENFIRPFDLAKAPLLRVGVIETGAGKKILLIDKHHIITDYTSHGILTMEFCALYAGPPLPPVRLHYKDYSLFQNSRDQRERIKTQEKFWLKEFAGKIPALDFPTDFPRPEIFNHVGNTVYFEIDPGLTLEIKDLTRETNTTLFMVLLAVYNILLAKYTGKEDIVVGTGSAGRNHADLQYIIGMFINMLALRNYPAPRKSFGKFLEEVKEKLVAAQGNGDYQFDELIAKLGLQGDLGSSPLLNAVLQVLNFEDQAVNLERAVGDQLKISAYERETNQTHFDLYLEAVEFEDKIHMSLTYAAVLFKRVTIEKIAGHFIDILKHVLEDKDTALEDIRISHGLLALEPAPLPDEEGEFEFTIDK